MKGRGEGFTIIELLVVITIVGLLSALALPTYLGYIRRARLAEAKLRISSLVKEEVIFYQENNTYSKPVKEETDYYIIVSDWYKNHKDEEGIDRHGKRFRAIPKDNVSGYVMSKIWIDDGNIRYSICSSYKREYFMQSKTYCP